MSAQSRQKVIVVFAVIAVLVAIILARHFKLQNEFYLPGSDQVRIGAGVPVLLELGSHTCVPCRMMMPVIKELAAEYAGSLGVKFIDVKRDTAAAKKYGISIIPTQIFFDPQGKELYRHQGFFAKEDILANWAELGIELQNSPVKK